VKIESQDESACNREVIVCHDKHSNKYIPFYANFNDYFNDYILIFITLMRICQT